jgi:hypothetical protein
MSTSPPTEIIGSNPKVSAQAQLAFIAELFRGTVFAMPNAKLQIMGSSYLYVNEIADAFENLQVQRQQIVPLVITNSIVSPPPSGFSQISPNLDLTNKATVVIDYGDLRPTKRFSVQFKVENNHIPIKAEFEVAPDGSMLSEVKVEWATPLKWMISDSARKGIRNVKIATKIIGIAGFDRVTVIKIETELKAKLKASFSFFHKIAGNEYIKIQFYADAGIKHAHGENKLIGGGGVLFEVPFDLSEVFK